MIYLVASLMIAMQIIPQDPASIAPVEAALPKAPARSLAPGESTCETVPVATKEPALMRLNPVERTSICWRAGPASNEG
jgi:hypothetical protein